MQKSVVRTSGIALIIMEKIAFADEALSQTEIAAAAGIVKSAAHKHLFTLEEAGWVARDPGTGRYHVGPKAWLVGQSATLVGDLVGSATPLMRATRQETGLAVVLSTVSQRALSVLVTLSGTHEIEIGVRRGSHLSLHGSAQGQVMLAFGEAGLLDEVADQNLPAHTPKTLTDPDQLRRRIAETARVGHAVAPEETLLGVNALAAPVFDHGNRLVATVALIGSIQHLPASPAETHISAIHELANAISRTQGHQVR